MFLLRQVPAPKPCVSSSSVLVSQILVVTICLGETEDYSLAVTPVCNPNAGTLTATASSACFNNGSASISATANGDANVPAGYQTIYVLTSGSGLVIEQVNSTPSFTVTAGGLYTIHTLVYNPATLDLTIVVPGQTTGFDVNGLACTRWRQYLRIT
jgi:hypothetical protein